MIPKSRTYRRVGKGQFLIKVPVAFSRRDVKSTDWEQTKSDIYGTVLDLLSESFNDVERDVRNKK